VPSPSSLLPFLAAALVLLAIPGPSVLFVVAQGMHRGSRAGLVSALGMGAGSMIHVAAAALGLSSLLATSAAAFEVVRYAGAAYLVAMGLRRILAPAPREPEALPAARSGRIFRQALVVNALNPKTALFFLAFLPQFLDPARGAVAVQVCVLGLIFTLLGLLSDGAYALVAGALGGRLRRSARLVRAERYASGGLLVALGVTAAVTGSHRRA
jgi:threonine/homoserine/homoserine lactone efflux protein